MIITNLFSIFDPSLSLFSSSWLILFFSLFFLPGLYFVSGFFNSFFNFLFNLLFKEVNYIFPSPKKGYYLFFSTIFLFISSLNFLALFPHIFSATSHLLVTLPISFSLWLGVIVFAWVNFLFSFLLHLVPSATPLPLISFLVLVEFLSNIIRPVALTFRLTANMMAGHLIISLLGGALTGLGFSSLLLGSGVLFFLTFMELGVCLIQAYVFSSLILLYMSEGCS